MNEAINIAGAEQLFEACFNARVQLYQSSEEGAQPILCLTAQADPGSPEEQQAVEAIRNSIAFLRACGLSVEQMERKTFLGSVPIGLRVTAAREQTSEASTPLIHDTNPGS